MKITAPLDLHKSFTTLQPYMPLPQKTLKVPQNIWSLSSRQLMAGLRSFNQAQPVPITNYLYKVGMSCYTLTVTLSTTCIIVVTLYHRNVLGRYLMPECKASKREKKHMFSWFWCFVFLDFSVFCLGKKFKKLRDQTDLAALIPRCWWSCNQSTQGIMCWRDSPICLGSWLEGDDGMTLVKVWRGKMIDGNSQSSI